MTRFLDEPAGINANCACDRHELSDIESAFTCLELRNSRLPNAKTLPKLYLRYPSVLPSRHEQLNHLPIEVGTK